MMTASRHIAVAAFALLPLQASAQLPPPPPDPVPACLPEAEMLNMLNTEFTERPVAIARSARDVGVILTVSPTGTWSLVYVDPLTRMACLVDGGGAMSLLDLSASGA